MNRASVRSAIFYVVTAVALLLLVTKTQKQFLPAGVATQIGHNSEALLFAILVAAQIQILRKISPGSAPLMSPRLVGIVVGAAVLIGLGLLLKDADFAATVVTLNEPLIGAGFVLLYLGLPRSTATAIAVTVAVVLYAAIFFDAQGGFVLDQAESLVPLALAGPALDIFDRTILRPELEDTPGLRLLWMGLLLAAVIGLIFAAHWAREDLHGALRYTIDYGQRAAEAYWGWLLVHLYFSYWLGPLWRRTTTDLAGSREQVRGGAAR